MNYCYSVNTNILWTGVVAVPMILSQKIGTSWKIPRPGKYFLPENLSQLFTKESINVYIQTCCPYAGGQVSFWNWILFKNTLVVSINFTGIHILNKEQYSLADKLHWRETRNAPIFFFIWFWNIFLQESLIEWKNGFQTKQYQNLLQSSLTGKIFTTIKTQNTILIRRISSLF